MEEFLEHVRTQLARLGELQSRKMFGGIGLYCDGWFFALIANDTLYLKVDDTNREDFEARGYEGFQPFPEKPGRMNYYEMPADVLERARDAVKWAARSVEVARQQPRKKKKARAGRKPAPDKLSALRNLGPRSTEWLAKVGIHTRADLERTGSIGAFLAVRESGQSSSLNLLYALEGALIGEPWNELPGPLKARLREAVARD